MRILILDGEQNQAVACVRSLGRAGHIVDVGSTVPSWKAGWSRYCNSRFVYPSPEINGRKFVDFIAERVVFASGTLVLPMTERTTLPISMFREQITAAGGSLLLPRHEAILTAFDKYETLRLARSIGISVPQTLLLSGEPDIDRITGTCSFPVAVKPRSSEQWEADGTTRGTGRMAYARNTDELVRALKDLRGNCNTFLVQEFVSGRSVGYFALMEHGKLRAEFAHERIRDVRPTGSGSALRRSIHPPSDIRAAGLALLQQLQWHGVAMVEFRLKSNGSPCLMEVNGRFWNSLPLAIHSGVNFPVLAAELVEKGDINQPAAYRENVRCRWLLGDFCHLLAVWRGAPRGFPEAFPSRFQTTYSFCAPSPGTFHDNFEWSDPLPEFGDWLHFILRKLPNAWKASGTPVGTNDAQKCDAHT